MTTSHLPLPDSYEGLYGRAQNLYRQGDLEGAITLYRRLTDKLGHLSHRILDRRPDLHDLHRQTRLELTSLLNLVGRYAEAIEVEEVLLQTHPDEANIWQRDIAVLRVAKGETRAGLAELRRLAEQVPDDAGGWIALGREARIEGRLVESREAFDRALKASGRDDAEMLAEIHYQRFLLFKEMRQLDDAVAAWEETVRCRPGVKATIREVYTMLTDAKRYNEALHFVARDDNALQAGFQRGLIASLTGNLPEARRAWRQVAGLDPGEFDYGHDAWVEAVLRLGDPIPALEWLQESLALHGTLRLWVLSGIAWAMNRDPELAATLFQQAINWLRHRRPPQKKLGSAEWRLLDSLVDDDETKTALKPYFSVIETLWG